ncbi:Mth938-like domain-containing protein [Caenispirillum salinarum]|uniref:Mth938-like domain-containing protein n=1 Tax=Caenispirillum salinarum TaxID=859058 RepID=UPI00384D002D
MDVTPLIPRDRKLIQKYGDGRFQITGESYEGSIIVFPHKVVPWPVDEAGQMTAESLEAVVEEAASVEILLVGCGRYMAPIPDSLRRHIKECAGATIDPMDTGAACRTYNVLLSEERRVAAALIAV